MSQPHTGDPCSRKRCKGTIHVYKSRRSKDGEFMTRYLRCRKCGGTVGCQVERCGTNPRSCGTTAQTAINPVVRIDQMDTNTNYSDEPWLTAFELGKWFNLRTTDDALGMVEDGLLPQPRVFQPLRWHQDDLIAWAAKTEGTTNG